MAESKDKAGAEPSGPKEPEKEGIGFLLYHSMRAHKDAIAQIDASTGERDTYAAFLQRCVRTAIKLRSKGVKAKDIVCLCSDNHLNSAVPVIASQFIGAIVAPVPPFLLPTDMERLLPQVNPKIVFVSQGALATVKEALNRTTSGAEIVVFGDSSEHSEFSEFLEPQEGEEQFQPIVVPDYKDTAIILFSSGTSGLPKGICLSHYALLSKMYNSMYIPDQDERLIMSRMPRISFPITFMGYATYNWISPTFALLYATATGNCRLICKKFEADDCWRLIDKFKPAFLSVMPWQLIEMCRQGKVPEGIDAKHLFVLVITGYKMPEEQMVKARAILPDADILQCYGTTEVCGEIISFKTTSKKERPLYLTKTDSCGVMNPDVSFKLVDPETNQEVTGPYKKGELRLKTRFMMNGYHNMDSSDAYDEDGWLKTNDIAYYDEDDCFYVVARYKELLKYRNVELVPATLEAELLKHPAVIHAVVFGLPHEIDGDHAMGVVVVDKNIKGVTEKDVERFVEERVEEWQRLRAGVKFVDSLPMTTTGKFDTKRVKKMAVEGKL